jgi:hypothetical protein
MPDSLHRLIYCSRNTMRGDTARVEREIRDILIEAQQRNRARGITGALLYTHGCFVQALEGTRDALEDTFERVQCSERHSGVTVLSFEPITERAFPDWDMAYLGDPESEASTTLAAMALDDAFAHGLTGGETVLSLMRGVVERQWAWAGAAEQ